MGGPPGGQRRERYSPADRSDMSPPMKRMRGGRDWEDRTPFPNYELGSYAHHNNWNQMDSGPNTQHRYECLTDCSIRFDVFGRNQRERYRTHSATDDDLQTVLTDTRGQYR